MVIIVEKPTLESDWSYASINIEVAISTRVLDTQQNMYGHQVTRSQPR